MIQSISASINFDLLPDQIASADIQKSAASQAPTTNAPQVIAEEIGPDQLKDAVGRINKTVQSLVSQLEFTIDTDTHMSVVKVIDTRTKEVLRQFPSEEVLQIAKALDNFTGLLLKDKA